MRSRILLALLVLLSVVQSNAYGQFQCEDIAQILRTQNEIVRLQEKYDAYLRTKYTWPWHDYFYGSFIDDDYETIYSCLQTGDRQLIAAYIDYILGNKKSADEAMLGYFGMLYLERKEDILAVLREYPTSDIDYIVNMLKEDAFFASPAGTLNVDIKPIRKELDAFRNSLQRTP